MFDSHEPLGHRIVTMLDVTLCGIGPLERRNYPRFECAVENTIGKNGTAVECLTCVPVHAQELVGA